MTTTELKTEFELIQSQVEANDGNDYFKNAYLENTNPKFIKIALIIALAVANALHETSTKSKWIRFWLVGKYLIQGIKASELEIDEVENLGA